MKSFNLKNFVRMTALALSLCLAPFALSAVAQNSGTTTTTQSSPSAPSGGTKTTVRETTQTETTTGVNPLWLALGGIALLAILLIAILSMRGRTRSRDGETVYESKTVVKKE